MKIVVSGSSGLVGSALTRLLATQGHDVVALVRRRPAAGEAAIGWDPERGTIDRASLEACDVVIHLASENTFGRWSPAKMQRIRDSRVVGTRLVSESLAGLTQPPALLLSASAVGFYGDRGDEVLTEESAPGDDFLARVARDWEAPTISANRAGIRVVLMRSGVVMSPAGGALKMMLPLFQLGLGGWVGSGSQYLSWIALDDLLGAIVHLMTTPTLAGAVNVTSPEPVTNREFAKALGEVLGRPVLVPVPTFALRIVLGTEGAVFVKTGQRVLPARLQQSGFEFRYPAVTAALRHLLAAPERGR